MEFVQQVQVLVAAARLGDAPLLFDDLEAHRRELRGLRGSMGMSMSRSSEPGGDTLVSVETRWADEAALNEYLGSARNAESIIRGHGDLTVPDSLSVRQLEALESERPSKQSILVDRFTIALFVPLGIVGFGLAIIYALSRIYLEMGSDGATPLAIVVALGILLVAWYFAENRAAPVWQMGAVGALVVSGLVGGTVWAQVSEGPHHESLVEVETPGGEETPAAPGEVVIELDDNEFKLAGSNAANPTIRVASGQVVTIRNVGNALHNMHVSPFDQTQCNANSDSPCSDPARLSAGGEGEITFDVPPGTYDYRCDFHPSEMFGTLEVGPPAAPDGGPPPGGEPPPGATPAP